MNAAAMLTAVLLMGVGDQVPPEMKVLERLVGTWKSENVLKTALATPTTSPNVGKNTLILGGHFIENKNYNNEGVLLNINIFSYDAKAQVYRQWLFMSDGNTLESTGTWDADTRTLTFTKEQGGNKGVFSMRFVDDDTVHTNIIWKDAAGKVTFDFEGKATRQKPGDAKVRVGVYDSRAIMMAFVDSDAWKNSIGKELDENRAAYDKAKAKGDNKRLAELDAWGNAVQVRLHRQGFGTVPVDDILKHIKNKMPEIALAAGVGPIVSKWDTRTLAKYKSAEQVEITMALVDAFHPTKEQRQKAIDIQKEKPSFLKDAENVKE